MLAMWKDVIGNDALAVCLRKLNQRHWTWRLFIQNRAQLGFRNNLFKHGELGAVEMIFLFSVIEVSQIQRPDANLRDFKRIENVHGNRIRALIRQMTTDSAAKSFKSLADVNRLAVVVVKGIDTPLAPSDFISIIVQAFKEGLYLLAN